MAQEHLTPLKLELENQFHYNHFLAAERFTRGRSYNIRMDDQVLLRFSPKNTDSTYYFSDNIGGTLTFFHEEGARRCLEVSVTLETSETINRRFVHPSRRNSPTHTKVQIKWRFFYYIVFFLPLTLSTGPKRSP
ncbi:unnamed protein product [Brassica oleracea]